MTLTLTRFFSLMGFVLSLTMAQDMGENLHDSSDAKTKAIMIIAITTCVGLPLMLSIFYLLIRLPLGAYVQILFKGEYTLTREIEIKAPIEQVFDVVTTARLWPNFYPETVAVGGVTDHPFVRGDLVIEKFMMMGWLYVVFNYTVEQYNKPWGIIFSTPVEYVNDFIDLLFGPFVSRFMGEFTYQLRERTLGDDSRITHWTRHLRFYHKGGYLGVTALVWRFFTCLHIRSQMRGATMFVENTRYAIEHSLI